MKKAWVLSYPLSAERRFWSDWADAQADLNFCWAHSHIARFVMSRLIYHSAVLEALLHSKTTLFQFNDNYSIFFRCLFHFFFMVIYLKYNDIYPWKQNSPGLGFLQMYPRDELQLLSFHLPHVGPSVTSSPQCSMLNTLFGSPEIGHKMGYRNISIIN